MPRPGEGKRGEAGYLAYLLRQAAGAIRVRMERALADLEVTAAQFIVLTMLDAYPGVSGADLARIGLLTPQTVHGITSNLLRARLIDRTASAVHGRIQVLQLTPSGQAILTRCKVRIAELEAGLADGLAAGEEDIVRRWLIKLAKPDQD